MYSEWASLQQQIEDGVENKSVLHSYPDSVGRDVAVSVVRELAAALSPASISSHESNQKITGLESEKEILWTMEASISFQAFFRNLQLHVLVMLIIATD
ncbi:Ral GTPase-activating protein subunit beta [Holothuria leucospilota]|uniref:Ral GTPase-activating protein subunit beta n=1 Tax=Holothuria leucospilota TaxID=206669 RepID=A0A9Q1BX49_HOLLE|nr:Ral GTPase-activating protein subunit beta [Holothuria leucospilota]